MKVLIGSIPFESGFSVLFFHWLSLKGAVLCITGNEINSCNDIIVHICLMSPTKYYFSSPKRNLLKKVQSKLDIFIFFTVFFLRFSFFHVFLSPIFIFFPILFSLNFHHFLEFPIDSEMHNLRPLAFISFLTNFLDFISSFQERSHQINIERPPGYLIENGELQRNPSPT